MIFNFVSIGEITTAACPTLKWPLSTHQPNSFPSNRLSIEAVRQSHKPPGDTKMELSDDVMSEDKVDGAANLYDFASGEAASKESRLSPPDRKSLGQSKLDIQRSLNSSPRGDNYVCSTESVNTKRLATKRIRSTRKAAVQSPYHKAVVTPNGAVGGTGKSSSQDEAVEESTPIATKTGKNGINTTSQVLLEAKTKQIMPSSDHTPLDSRNDLPTARQPPSEKHRKPIEQNKEGFRPNSLALGPLQVAISNIGKDPSQCSREGTDRHNKRRLGDFSDKTHFANIESGSINQNHRAAKPRGVKVELGFERSSALRKKKDESRFVLGEIVSKSMWRRLKSKERAKVWDVKDSETILAPCEESSLQNILPTSNSSTQITNHSTPSPSPKKHFTFVKKYSQLTNKVHQDKMTAGSTHSGRSWLGASFRGNLDRINAQLRKLILISHLGRTMKEASFDNTKTAFQTQQTPSTSSSRRPRGFQPDEVRQGKQKLGPEDTTPNTTSLQVSSKTLPASGNQSSPPNPTSPKSKPLSTLAPHLRAQSMKAKPDHHIQPVQMKPPAPDLGEDDSGKSWSKLRDSEISSVQNIVDQQPSCWSRASSPKAPVPEWDNHQTDIDRPAWLVDSASPDNILRRASLNWVRRRYITPSSKAERLTASNSSARQLTNSGKDGLSSELLTSSEDEHQSHVNLAEQKDNQVTALATGSGNIDTNSDLENHVGQLHQSEALEPQQISTREGIKQKVHANSSHVKNDEDVPTSISTALHTDQALPSACPWQEKDEQPITVAKEKVTVLPHLRAPKVTSSEKELSEKAMYVPPHLRKPTTHFVPVDSSATAHQANIKSGKQTITAMQDCTPRPHLQNQSANRSEEIRASLPTASMVDQQKEAHHPTVDMDEEIAATQPVLDVDEEIAAGLRAETFGEGMVAEGEEILNTPHHEQGSASVRETQAIEHNSKFPRDTKSNAKFPATQKKVNHSSSNGGAIAANAVALKEVITTRKNVIVPSPSLPNAQNGNGSSAKKDKRPARDFEYATHASDLAGWDGKMINAPVGDDWNNRPGFDTRDSERLSVIKLWSADRAADLEKNPVIVDVAQTDFQSGGGLAAGDGEVRSPINEADHEAIPNEDKYTQANRHKNSADAIKAFEAKKVVKSEPVTTTAWIKSLSKEEKRAYRRSLREDDHSRDIPPNPHAPVANIYLRPAEHKDMRQVTDIYNYYVRQTYFTLHANDVDELHWRDRLQDSFNEHNPFIVAIHMGEKSCRDYRDIIRRKQENVVGFAVAANMGEPGTVYSNSVELDLMVHQDFRRQGIGKSLLDRILASLVTGHHLLECAPFISNNDISHWVGGGSRQAPFVTMTFYHQTGSETEFTWRKEWWAKLCLRHVGTLRKIGIKLDKP